MAKRDVELIIKAKDEASRALNSIAAELDALIGKQTGLTRSGSGASATIAGMVAELAKFEKVCGLVAQAADRSEAAIVRQRQSIDASAGALAAVNAQLASARSAISNAQSGIIDTRLAGGDTTKQVADLKLMFAEVVRLEAEQARLSKTVTAQTSTLAEQERAFAEVASMANSATAAIDNFGDAEERAALKSRAAGQAAEQAAAARRMAGARASFNGPTDDGSAGVPRAADTALADLIRDEERQATALQRLLDRADPAAAIHRQLAADVELARKAMKAGTLTAEQFAKAEAELTRQAKAAEDALERTGKGAAGKPGLFGLKPYELTNLGYQVNDVVTGLASGQRPMQIIAQQGGQILQLMPNIGAKIASAFSNPYVLAAAGVFGAVAVGIKRSADEAERLRKIEAILLQAGDGAGVTSDRLVQVAEAMEDVGLTSEQSLSLIRDFMTQGLNPAYLQAFAKATKDAATVTGQDLTEAVADAEAAFSKGYKAVAELDDKLQFLTTAERAQIKAMFDAGNAAGARELAFRRYADKMAEIAAASKGEWADAFKTLGNSVDNLLDKFAKTDIIQGFEDALKAAIRGIGDALVSIDAMDQRQVTQRIAAIQTLRSTREQHNSRVDNAGDSFLMMTEEQDLAALKARQAELDKVKQSHGDLVKQEAAANEKRRADRLAEISDEERLSQLRDASSKQQRALTTAETQQRAALAGRLAYQQELNQSGDVEIARAKQRVAAERELEQVRASNRQAVQRDRAEREREIQQFNNRVIGAEGGAARNPRSTAQGFGQFLNTTWIEQFRKVFASEAEKLSQQQILALRNNQTVAKAIIDNYARENARFLEGFGAKVTAGNLYLAHFLGPAGAKKVLTANPNTPVDSLLNQDVMKANPEYLRMAGGKGRARTAGELVQFIGGRVGDTGQAQSAGQAAIADLIRESEQAQENFNLLVTQGNDERQRSIDALKIENGLQYERRIDAQKQIAVEKAVFDLRKKVDDLNKNLKPGETAVVVTDEQISKTRELAAAEFDLANARQRAQATTDRTTQRVGDLAAQRSAIEQQIAVLRDVGDYSGAQALLPQVQAINAELVKAIDAALAFYEALDPATDSMHRTREQIEAAKAGLKVLRAETLNWADAMAFTAKGIQGAFAGSLSDSFKQFAKDIANGENAFESLGRAALSFVATFLEKLADMGLQMLAFRTATALGFNDMSGGLNRLFGVATSTGGAVGAVAGGVTDAAGGAAMTAAGTTLTTAGVTLNTAATALLSAATMLQAGGTAGGGGGGLLGAIVGAVGGGGPMIPGTTLPGIYHSGGIAGAASVTRAVSPAWFQHATRYHRGGLAGLRPDEVPAILQRGEEILTRGDRRHRHNGGGERGGTWGSAILAVGDKEIAGAMAGAAGEEVTLIHLRRNIETVRQWIGGNR